MQSRASTSRDERLHLAAAGHYALAADNHDNLAARYARDGDPLSAAHERTLAQAARNQAQRSRDRAALHAEHAP